MNNENPLKPRLQTNWDWRAAGNFIGGGSGAGLLLFSAIAASPHFDIRWFWLAALVFIGAGLICVWMEIGRPFRAMNVFRHARTSWMTREALVAPLLFGSAGIAVWRGGALWIWLAVSLAMLFLYCQSRMINAAKGIPAWRAQRIVPLFLVTGLTEGAGLLALGLALSGTVAQASWIAPVLVPLLILRALLWRSYRKELVGYGTPQPTLAALDAIELPLIKMGHWAAAGFLLLALAVPVSVAPWLIGAAGLAAALAGWLLKHTLIVRASYQQGYALPRLPVRGAGVPIRNV